MQGEAKNISQMVSVCHEVNVKHSPKNENAIIIYSYCWFKPL